MEEIIKQMLGELNFQVAQLAAENNMLKKEIERLRQEAKED